MYQMQTLKSEQGLVHGFSTLADGNMSFVFGSPEEVIINRKNFLGKLDIRLEQCVIMRAQHSDKILHVNSKDAGKGSYTLETGVVADGLISSVKDIFIILLVADCLPIILYDKKKSLVALVHAGWMGTEKHIAELGVNKMVDEFYSDPKELLAILGPCIKKESYKFRDPAQKNCRVGSLFYMTT